MYSYWGPKDHGESVYRMVPPRHRQEERYVSKYSCKVRQDFNKNIKGDSKTMGKKLCVNPPQRFLKKHTRCSPTFHRKRCTVTVSTKQEPQQCDIKLENGTNVRDKSKWCNDFDLTKEESCGTQFQCGYNGPVQTVERGCPDFIQKNAITICRTCPTIPKQRIVDSNDGHQSYIEKPYVLRKGFGQVPAYLEKRKCEMYKNDKKLLQEIEAQRECREIGTEERQCIIVGLEQKFSELTKEYFRIPISSLNPRVLKAKEEIEIRLENIEKDLSLFKGSKKIFVNNRNKLKKFH